MVYSPQISSQLQPLQPRSTHAEKLIVYAEAFHSVRTDNAENSKTGKASIRRQLLLLFFFFQTAARVPLVDLSLMLRGLLR